MTISCPNCNHSTDVPGRLLSAEGTQMRCPSCSISFTALPSGFTMASSEGAASGEAGSRSGAVAPRPDAGGAAPESPSGSEAASPASPFKTTGGASQPGQGSAGHGLDGQGPVLAKGTRLAGQYEIASVLGRGRFAMVYEAEDVHVGEGLALKVIPAASAQAAQAGVRSLAAEYRATRDLRGPGRPHVLRIDRPQVAQEEGLDWVVLPMERAAGTLREWLQARPADARSGRPGEAIAQGIKLLQQVCRGLEALHAAGRAHLDVKPGNVLLFPQTDNGRKPAPEQLSPEQLKAEQLSAEELIAKVGDFGLTRSLRGEVLDASMHRGGVGTPTYMAPEQVFTARQKEVGPAADVYALGVLLFELLDGDPPFDGSAESVRRKHREVAPPKVHTAQVPEHLEALAYRCLAKDPAERPASMAAVREQLQEGYGEPNGLPASAEPERKEEPVQEEPVREEPGEAKTGRDKSDAARTPPAYANEAAPEEADSTTHHEKLTPLDIREKDFERSLRGYSVEEVENFLETVAGQWEN